MKDKKISLKDKKRIPPSKARKHVSHRSEIRPSLSPNISSNFHNTYKIKNRIHTTKENGIAVVDNNGCTGIVTVDLVFI